MALISAEPGLGLKVVVFVVRRYLGLPERDEERGYQFIYPPKLRPHTQHFPRTRDGFIQHPL